MAPHFFRILLMEALPNGNYVSVTQRGSSTELHPLEDLECIGVDSANGLGEFFDRMDEVDFYSKNGGLSLRGIYRLGEPIGPEEIPADLVFAPAELRRVTAEFISLHRFWSHLTRQIRVIQYGFDLALVTNDYHGYTVVGDQLFYISERTAFYGSLKDLAAGQVRVHGNVPWPISNESITPEQEGFFYGIPLSKQQEERFNARDNGFLLEFLGKPPTHLFSRVSDAFEDKYAVYLQAIFRVCDYAEEHGYQLYPVL